jgi:hypothetical protein
MTTDLPVPPPAPAPAPLPPESGFAIGPSSPMPAPEPGVYRDDEIVYVDPDTRLVVGRLEWSRSGNPKSMPYKAPEPEPEAPKEKPKEGAVKGKPERRRGSGRKNYPYGTYKSMKNAFRLEGKQKKGDPTGVTLDDVIEKALAQPFWD